MGSVEERLPVPRWVEVDADGLVADLGPGATWLGRLAAMLQVPFAALPLFSESDIAPPTALLGSSTVSIQQGVLTVIYRAMGVRVGSRAIPLSDIVNAGNGCVEHKNRSENLILFSTRHPVEVEALCGLIRHAARVEGRRAQWPSLLPWGQPPPPLSGNRPVPVWAEALSLHGGRLAFGPPYRLPKLAAVLILPLGALAFLAATVFAIFTWGWFAAGFLFLMPLVQVALRIADHLSAQVLRGDVIEFDGDQVVIQRRFMGWTQRTDRVHLCETSGVRGVADHLVFYMGDHTVSCATFHKPSEVADLAWHLDRLARGADSRPAEGLPVALRRILQRPLTQREG